MRNRKEQLSYHFMQIMIAAFKLSLLFFEVRGQVFTNDNNIDFKSTLIMNQQAGG